MHLAACNKELQRIYLSKGVKATNAQLVERARTIVESMGAKVATPDEGR